LYPPGCINRKLADIAGKFSESKAISLLKTTQSEEKDMRERERRKGPENKKGHGPRPP
jgi:hypothetical protein